GRVPLDNPESKKRLADWTRQPGMYGLRFALMKEHQQSWPLDGTMDWIWPAADEAGLPVAFLAAHFLPVVDKVAQRHPNLKIAVAHMAALRGKKGDEAFGNLPQLLALAKYPNVSVKLSGGPGYATDPYPFRSLHKPYRAIYDAFGPQRIFWGTDITRMPCSW